MPHRAASAPPRASRPLLGAFSAPPRASRPLLHASSKPPRPLDPLPPATPGRRAPGRRAGGAQRRARIAAKNGAAAACGALSASWLLPPPSIPPGFARRYRLAGFMRTRFAARIVGGNPCALRVAAPSAAPYRVRLQSRPSLRTCRGKRLVGTRAKRFAAVGRACALGGPPLPIAASKSRYTRVG